MKKGKKKGHLYVLRFDPPYTQRGKQVHFRLGCSVRLQERLNEHLGGGVHSAAMVRNAVQTGRKVFLYCVWPGDYTDEARYKRWHNVPLAIKAMKNQGAQVLDLVIFDGEKPCNLETISEMLP